MDQDQDEDLPATTDGGNTMYCLQIRDEFEKIIEAAGGTCQGAGCGSTEYVFEIESQARKAMRQIKERCFDVFEIEEM
jgi:hypothetical protein